MAFEAVRQVASFYNYGRKHFTQTGWRKTIRLNTSTDVTGKAFVITGANSGLGKCLSTHLHAHGAMVYMVCRNPSRAEEARKEILALNKQRSAENLKIVIGDMTLKSGVEGVVSQLAAERDVIDGLVCNAGCESAECQLTDEGVEKTFACSFLMGSYLLGSKLMPMLKKSEDPRVLMVATGGVYSARLQTFKSALVGEKYNGLLTYARAKRAQVVLAEAWAVEHPTVKVVSLHPGWVWTPICEASFNKAQKWMLSPWRTVWEGTEGMAWLCQCKGDEIESGAFYLDGKVEPKHLRESTNVKPETQDKFIADLRAYGAEYLS